MRRVACLGLLLGLFASIGSAGPAALPDLAVLRDGLQRTPAGLEATIVNRGGSTSPAAAVRARDRSPLLGRGPAHEILAGERAAVFHAEREGTGRLLLVMSWSAPRPGDTLRGTLILVGGRFAAPIPGAPIEVRVEAGERLRFDTGGIPGGVLRLPVEPASAGRPVAVDLSGIEISGRRRPREIWFGHRWLAAGSPEADDDGPEPDEGDPVLFDLVPAPRSEPAYQVLVSLPPLPAGRSATVRFDGVPAGRPLFVTVDPEDRVTEEREGNNTATLEPPGRGPLAALHLHTSFSEGRASFDLQCRALGESGYGLAWITDHDWRLRLLGFAAATPEGGGWPGRGRLEAGEWDVPEGVTRPPLAGATGDGERATPGIVLELPPGGTEAGRPGPRDVTLTLREPRNTHLVPLAADLRLGLRVDEPRLPDGTALLVRLTLSDHPAERRRLTYLIAPTERGAHGLALPGERTRVLALPAARPAAIDIDVSADARASWPGLLDDHLHQVEVGLRRGSRQGASIRVLEIRTRTGEPAPNLFLAARRLADGYPNLALSVGAEISHPYPHFNAFARDLPVLDYGALPNREEYGREAVRHTRALGGLVSFNHPFGALVRYEPDFLAQVLQQRFFDADLLEVGYRRRGGHALEDHLALWDRAGAVPIILTGIGTTDSHGEGPGIGWHGDESNLATRLRSTPVESAARDLAAGRVDIEDPLSFSGRLQLTAAGRFHEGDVVVVDARGRHLPGFTLTGSELPAGGQVILLAGGERLETLAVSAPDLGHPFRVDRAAGPVRAELRDAAGAPLILGNPIYVVAAGALPAAGVAADRAALFFPFFSSTGGHGFRIRSVASGRRILGFGRGAVEVRLDGEAGGEIPIQWASAAAPGAVEAADAAGAPIPVRGSTRSGEVVIGPFPAAGAVRVTLRPPADAAGRWLVPGAALALLLVFLALRMARRRRPARA